MSETREPFPGPEQIRNAIDRMRQELPQLANVLDAFEPLFAERAAFREELPGEEASGLSIDEVQYSQGVPVLGDKLFSVPGDLMKDAARRLIPAMEKGFPRIKEDLAAVLKALEEDKVVPADLGGPASPESDKAVERLAGDLNLDPSILKFVVVELSRPFAQRRAQGLGSLLEQPAWFKGYCPVCGSWPELSYLEGQEGRRWLRCSYCGHHWTYMRTSCPFCETDDQEKMELFYSEDRSWERAELCYQCNKYIVGVDLRNRVPAALPEVAALGLVYLDLLAQEKGFEPGAVTGWNKLG